MIHLALAIFSTVILFLIFKEYEKKGINTQQAITFNYLTAALISLFIVDTKKDMIELIHTNWFYLSIILGVLFIIMFNIMAITTQRLGISISSMASKMSLIIPVIGAILLQDATLEIYKISAITIAIIAVYLTFIKKQQTNRPILAIILFFGAGILDMSIDFIRNNYLSSTADFNLFIFIVFCTAFILGIIKLIYNKTSILLKNIISGIILGVPNYFSIYFILLALEDLGGIYVFPILNIGVVLFSAIISWRFYEEEMSRTNWIGISLACLSIIMLLG